MEGKQFRVLEFFAGVGGFRGGLEGFPGKKTGAYEVVWSSQFEPSTKRQHASEVYVARWGALNHSNEDINAVLADPSKFGTIMQAQADVLVGGFPCQDYSVAKSANSAAGIEGKKGVLWWSIHETLRRLAESGQPIRHVILENVDRLLKSPTKCRGRDFGIILSSLAQLGYAVEWRVVNAADYGYPQKRRRVFIVAHHQSTDVYSELAQSFCDNEHFSHSTYQRGVLACALPWQRASEDAEVLVGNDPLLAQSVNVSCPDGATRFFDVGVMVNGRVKSCKVAATGVDDCKAPQLLGDVVQGTDERSVPSGYYIPESDLAKWRYLKGSKSLSRTSKSGHVYTYSEGPMPFPDCLSKPGRTIITAEGGATPSRFKHVIETSDGRLRRLIPDELEEMNGFPRGFTELDGVSDTKRAFFMGNALVVGLVEKIGSALHARLLKDS